MHHRISQIDQFHVKLSKGVEEVKALVLAGGSGERFWPLSTFETPKQFLKLFNNKSLLRLTLERLLHRLHPDDIYIVTLSDYTDKTRQEAPEIPPGNVLGEPYKRNTAAACVFGTSVLEPDEIVLVVPADHRIMEVEKFWNDVEKAVEGVKKYGGLFTFGIVPSRPETGYGYIEADEELEEGIFKIKQFREKPNLETAMEFLEMGNFFWNSGMFVWKAKDFLEEVRLYAPELYHQFEGRNLRNQEVLKAIYKNVTPISVDYAVMERSRRVRMVKASFDWSDVGNWASIREIEGYTADRGNVVIVDGERVYVRSGGKPVALVGLSDVIVIDTEKGLLIAHEEKLQKVREVVRKLRERSLD